MPTMTAAVTREQGKPLTLEQVELDDIRPDEARVRMVATGICHTDAIVRDGVYRMMIRNYKLDDLNLAFSDSASGETVKPVVVY